MARERKCRRVCFEPVNKAFIPDKQSTETVILSMEECEAIRLADHEQIEQVNASEMMNISRSTFQRILYSARYKVADALICGKSIVIDGGDYSLAKETCGCAKKCGACRFDKK